MDSIFIVQYGNGGGIISVHYDEDDANEALRVALVEPKYADGSPLASGGAYVEQWEVA